MKKGTKRNNNMVANKMIPKKNEDFGKLKKCKSNKKDD
jgi:hypothetical protein